MNYTPQVGKEHYAGQAYRSGERWSSYWHQIAIMRSTGAESVLEVGMGEGVVARQLAAGGIKVETLDIAEDLKPDVVGSVTAIPLPDKSYDAVLAAEVLEHITFDDLPQALREMVRVARKFVMISVPHPGYVFSIIYKVPLLPRISLLYKIPFFWKTHTFNGQHYWELGKKGYSVNKFLKEAKTAGLTLVEHKAYADDPAHRFFLFRV